MTKTFILTTVAAAGLALATIPSAFANPYDDCILQYMGNATNENAVNAVETACISKVSVALSQDDASKVNFASNCNPGDDDLA